MNEVALGRAGHLNRSDFELYVIQGLALDRAAEVEDHVACCEACADALAREAQLEMALEMVAARAAEPLPRSAPVVHLVPKRSSRVAAGLTATLAAAAALVLWIMPWRGTPTSADGATYGSVMADAAGAMVSFDATKGSPLDALDGG